MKQTKPYGRAHVASDSLAKHPPRQDKPRPVASMAPSSSVQTPTVVARGQPSSGRRPPVSVAEWSMKALSHAVLGVALCSAYVFIRDSTLVQNLISQVTSYETVMKCEEGRVDYVDWSVWDRLWGNGTFVCTQWKVQSRFVNPRPF